MRETLFILCVLCSASLSGQQATSVHWWQSADHQAYVGANVALNLVSSDLSNRFMATLLFDDVANKTVIKDQLSRLSDKNNLMGGDYEISIRGKYRLPMAYHSVLVKLADVAHMDAQLTGQAVQIAMLGNKPFAGDTIDLSGTGINLWRYQQYGVGWAYQPAPSTEFFAMGSYINGEQLLNAKLENAWMYTSSLGDTLSIEAEGSYTQSDTGKVGFAKPNGAGFALDFGVHTEFQGAASSWDLDVGVFSLGMVQWTPATIHYQADSSLEFTGVPIGDFRTVNERLNSEQFEDSLIGGIADEFVRGVSNRVMPGCIQADVMQRKGQGTEFGGGLVLRWKSGSKPYTYLRGGYRFNERIATHAQLGYGGYGSVQVALDTTFELEHLSLAARISNLEAYVLPSKFAGASGQVAVHYLF